MGYRPTVMRAVVVALLATLLASLLLVGCGDETSSGGKPDTQPPGPVGFEVVEMVTETAVGGMSSPGAVALADAAATQQFTAQFEDDRMETRLVALIEGLEVPDDQAAYAAVVGIGCTPPTDVTVTSTDTGVVIEPVKPTTKPVECFAPATTVAVVLVDESLVG